TLVLTAADILEEIGLAAGLREFGLALSTPAPRTLHSEDGRDGASRSHSDRSRSTLGPRPRSCDPVGPRACDCQFSSRASNHPIHSPREIGVVPANPTATREDLRLGAWLFRRIVVSIDRAQGMLVCRKPVSTTPGSNTRVTSADPGAVAR